MGPFVEPSRKAEDIKDSQMNEHLSQLEILQIIVISSDKYAYSLSDIQKNWSESCMLGDSGNGSGIETLSCLLMAAVR